MNRQPTIAVGQFGTIGGKPVALYTLTNSRGTQIKLSSYGGIITSWTIPTSDGSSSPIILGFDSLEEYLAQPFYMGATIGRYANLIDGASFELEGKTYHLSSNHRGHHLHGGTNGFDKKHWDTEIISHHPPTITLRTLSKDLEEGYPGNLEVAVTFQLTDDDELIIDYRCETDQTTPVSLTNHMYFNLNGNFEKDITDHSLMIEAGQITPAQNGITTGDVLNVTGTPYDFRKNTPLAPGIGILGGYNHNFILKQQASQHLKLAAVLSNADHSRKLEVYTTEPALQLYTGNSLAGGFRDRSGAEIRRYTGLCLEPQQIPNSPNHPHFPTTLLTPGTRYASTTRYKIVY
mgnify:CR=1 FL=1